MYTHVLTLCLLLPKLRKKRNYLYPESNTKAESTDSNCSWQIFSKMNSNKENPSHLSEQNSETGLEKEAHTFFTQKTPQNEPQDIRIHERKDHVRIFSRAHISVPDWSLFSWFQCLQHCPVCFFLLEKKNNALFITNSPGNKLDDLGSRIVPKYVAMQKHFPAKVLQSLQH